MITTVTLNPCIDRTVMIDEFKFGQLNKLKKTISIFAGKGFNASKGIAHLGHQTTATGFLYIEEYNSAKQALETEGIIVDCVVCPGHLRLNTKVFDEKTRKVTELNEMGNETDPEYLAQVVSKVIELSKRSEYVILSGSIPPKCPSSVYADIITKIKSNCKVILDASGAALKSGVSSLPTIVKPNKDELVELLGRPINSVEEVKIAAKELVERGIEIVCVSLGSEGAVITNGSESYFAPPVPEIDVRGTVCAGDSMVAGLSVGLADGLTLKDAFKKSVAAATACILQEGSAVVTKDLLEQIIDKVVIQSI